MAVAKAVSGTGGKKKTGTPSEELSIGACRRWESEERRRQI